MLATLLLCVAGLATQPVSLPEPQREFRAAWIATVDNIDWPSKPGLSTNEQRAELLEIVELADELNLNALIFQVRPHADAMYPSELEPWSEYLTGRQGKAPEPLWDPLEFIIAESHKRGIELHAWFNPYRSWHPAAEGPKSPKYVGNTHPEAVRTYGRFEWMDPSDEFVKNRTLAVMMDVVERYNLDGIHIDDYFYPYPVTENGQKVDFPDQENYDAYLSGGGTLNRGDWRRMHVNDMVARIYEGTKQRKKHVKFGISPFGIYRPGVPAGINAGVDQYAELYADALKWFQEGTLDYLTPQLYWPVAQTAQSYPVLLNWWAEQNASGRHLWPGNFTSRLNSSDGNWTIDELLNQIDLTRKNQGSTGNVHFSFKAFALNWKGVQGALKRGPYAQKAVVPASSWIDTKRPGPLSNAGASSTRDGYEITFTQNPAESDVRWVLIWAQREGKWQHLDTVPLASGRATVPASPKIDRIAVQPVDLAGNLGPAFPLTIN